MALSENEKNQNAQKLKTLAAQGTAQISLPEMPAFSLPEGPNLAEVKLPAAPGKNGVKVPKAPALTDAGAPTAPQVQINDYSRYIQEMQKASTEAELAEYEAAYQKNVNAIDRAAVGVDQTYRNARNQAVGAADVARRNFAETAGASGLNSGTGGQAALAHSVAVQNDLNELGAQQAQTLADLEQQRADNALWYDNAIAAAKAEGDRQTAQLLYQEKLRVEEDTVAAMQQKFENERAVYLQQMEARQQQFENEVVRYDAQREEAQQQFENEVQRYRWQIETRQQQFDNEVTRKKLEYQQLRDRVSDEQWLAQFDRACAQWLQQVETQRQQMDFERQQWERDVALQREKMDTAYVQWLQGVTQEQAQMQFDRERWESDTAMQREKLEMQKKSLKVELVQKLADSFDWED